jgi:hypothetical protein
VLELDVTRRLHTETNRVIHTQSTTESWPALQTLTQVK